MALKDLSDKLAVESALDEFDRLGRSEFLKLYGFGKAQSYFILRRGVRYDSKAIAGAAHKYQFPELGPLTSQQFSGGEQTVASKLRELGYQVSQKKRASRERLYWAFCANPKRYRIREAVDFCEIDWWTVGRSQPRRGDRALFWQTLDSDGNRGLIAFGKILGDPELRADEGNPFWVDRAGGNEEYARVPVCYFRSENMPLWLDDSAVGKLLSGLKVAKAQGGTIFSVTEEQWQSLTDLIGFEFPSDEELELMATGHLRGATTSGGLPLGGQGFGLTASERAAVELRAMELARRYLQTKWPIVTDVSARMSFDLLCKAGQSSLRVEVKGTTGPGESVLLTKNEVRESAESGYAVFVVSEIQLDRSDPDQPIASGGVCRFFESFNVNLHVLEALSYRCKLDLSKSTMINWD